MQNTNNNLCGVERGGKEGSVCVENFARGAANKGEEKKRRKAADEMNK